MMDKEDYEWQKGETCPMCGSGMVEAVGGFHNGYPEFSVARGKMEYEIDMECLECRGRWREFYRLDRLEILKEGREL